MRQPDKSSREHAHMRLVGTRVKTRASGKDKDVPENLYGWASAAGLSAIAATLVYFLTTGLGQMPTYDDVEITGSIGTGRPTYSGQLPRVSQPYPGNPYGPERNEVAAAPKGDLSAASARRSDTELLLLRQEIANLSGTIDTLRTENLSLGRRITALEDALGSITASIPESDNRATRIVKMPPADSPVAVEVTNLDPANAADPTPSPDTAPSLAAPPKPEAAAETAPATEAPPAPAVAAPAPEPAAEAAKPADPAPMATTLAGAEVNAEQSAFPTPKPRVEAMNDPTGTASPPRQVSDLNAPASRTEFGIDLGTAATMPEITTKWAALNTVHGPVLKGLTPVAAIGEDVDRQIELHLIAGPFANAADAAARCAEIQGSGNRCKPTVYQGQRLDLR